jgi:hypothetical protein
MVIVFPTTHLRTIMKPRRISSDCGLAIRVDPGSLDSCREALTEDGLLPARFFRETGGDWECVEELGEDGSSGV